MGHEGGFSFKVICVPSELVSPRGPGRAWLSSQARVSAVLFVPAGQGPAGLLSAGIRPSSQHVWGWGAKAQVNTGVVVGSTVHEGLPGRTQVGLAEVTTPPRVPPGTLTEDSPPTPAGSFPGGFLGPGLPSWSPPCG